jgi:hypothetical protein
MRDLASLLTSFVNIDRASLVAILTAEASASEQLVNATGQRTPSQRAKRKAAVERTVRVKRMLSFFRDGETPTEMSKADLAVCRSLEQKLRG